MALGPWMLKLTETMQLGKVERGSLISDRNYKSLNARCFGFNKKNKEASEEDSRDDMEGEFIQRYTLVTIKFKRGQAETIEYYRVLAIFSKHYNK